MQKILFKAGIELMGYAVFQEYLTSDAITS